MPTADQNLDLSGSESWAQSHDLDARYRLPWFGGPIYIRVMMGRDRRPHHRSQAHAAASIRRSALNIALIALGACVLYTAIAAALLLMSSVLQ